MKRSSVVVLTVIALAVGIGVGLTIAQWRLRELSDRISSNQGHANAAAATSLLDTAALVRLKDNDVSGAQSVLEAAVGSNLISTGSAAYGRISSKAPAKIDHGRD